MGPDRVDIFEDARAGVQIKGSGNERGHLLAGDPGLRTERSALWHTAGSDSDGGDRFDIRLVDGFVVVKEPTARRLFVLGVDRNRQQQHQNGQQRNQARSHHQKSETSTEAST